jgi:hypothetical protein
VSLVYPTIATNSFDAYHYFNSRSFTTGMILRHYYIFVFVFVRFRIRICIHAYSTLNTGNKEIVMNMKRKKMVGAKKAGRQRLVTPGNSRSLMDGSSASRR